jgi:hypothetical protein
MGALKTPLTEGDSMLGWLLHLRLGDTDGSRHPGKSEVGTHQAGKPKQNSNILANVAAFSYLHKLLLELGSHLPPQSTVESWLWHSWGSSRSKPVFVPSGCVTDAGCWGLHDCGQT